MTSGLALAAPATFSAVDAAAAGAPAGPAEPSSKAAGGEVKLPKLPRRPRIDALVHINQVGFRPHEPKRAVVAASGSVLGHAFAIVDDAVTPTARYRGTLGSYPNPGRYGHYANHFYADFSDFDRPGRYRLRLSDGHLSPPFSIGEDLYEQLIPLVLQYFDLQRCGEQESAYRGTCHHDDGVISGGPRHGQRLDVSGGWHDAGDYLKFVETTSYAAAVMLFAFDLHAARLGQALHRRRSRSGLPLPLSYARVGLEWLLKMHPRSNEFYYQAGDRSDHDRWRLPEQDDLAHDSDWKPRPVFYGIGANLAGRTAAALATAYRVYYPYDRPFAARCLAAAKSVYELGLRNQSVLTTNPADFYPETTWADDMEWGAVCLYKATGHVDYLRQALRFSEMAGPAQTYTSVYSVNSLAHYSLYPYAHAADKKRLLEYLHADARDIREQALRNPYGLGTPYVWGTAEAAAGAAISCLAYANLAGAPEYTEAARQQRDFVLGCNPFGLCCLVGAGTRYPLFPHHQIANIRNIELSGAVVGGPCDAKTYKDEHIHIGDVEFSSMSPSPIPAEDAKDEVGVYHDVVEDYVTNEAAIDYTSTFLLLATFYVPEG
jgi:hypothetical protein